MIRTCQKEGTDLLLIAGDLFHRQPLRRELKEVDGMFASLKHTKVVLIAGNHDYIRRDSYYRTFSWSENVTMLREETADLCRISGTGYGSIWPELSCPGDPESAL